jgi:hypothetical protein
MILEQRGLKNSKYEKGASETSESTKGGHSLENVGVRNEIRSRKGVREIGEAPVVAETDYVARLQYNKSGTKVKAKS